MAASANCEDGMVTSSMKHFIAKFPKIVCGMFQIKDPAVVANVMDHALGCGYRSFDTASVYKNENIVGDILPMLLDKHHLTREDIFVTTKLGPKDLGSESVVRALNISLNNLKLDYIDLYLIHWPGKQGLKQTDPMNKKYRRETWIMLEEIQKNSNKIRHIGVSNYTLRHLKEMKDYASKLPEVVQNEYHPDFQDQDVFEFCDQNNIHFQAYSPLGSSHLVNDERFSVFSQKYNKSISQVLLKWSLQNGSSVVPKSTSFAHISENINILNEFELADEDIVVISQMSKNVKYCWNPENVF